MDNMQLLRRHLNNKEHMVVHKFYKALKTMVFLSFGKSLRLCCFPKVPE